MKKEEVLGILQDNGFVLDEEKPLPGVRFSFSRVGGASRPFSMSNRAGNLDTRNGLLVGML